MLSNRKCFISWEWWRKARQEEAVIRNIFVTSPTSRPQSVRQAAASGQRGQDGSRASPGSWEQPHEAPQGAGHGRERPWLSLVWDTGGHGQEASPGAAAQPGSTHGAGADAVGESQSAARSRGSAVGKLQGAEPRGTPTSVGPGPPAWLCLPLPGVPAFFPQSFHHLLTPRAAAAEHRAGADLCRTSPGSEIGRFPSGFSPAWPKSGAGPIPIAFSGTPGFMSG